VVRELVRTGTPLTLGVEQRFLTIMFTDIQNFSSHAERMPPNELLGQMSVYFEQVSRAIAQEYGTVDKFIGDGVMAFWGAPVERPDHALRACAAALRATRRMSEANDRWAEQGGTRLRIRIGLHSADVLVGNVGSTERLSYTVMGDGVNIAARLEGMNKVFGTTICISENVRTAAGPKLVVRPLREIRVKGRVSALMTYELLGIEDESDSEVSVRAEDGRLARMTWEAWQSLQSGDVEKAAQGYQAILEAFPGDDVARSQLDACEASQFERLG
jgi:adenylate cyclase